MELFPAVIVGGPPNSGKSVLTANLTQALRQRGVQHYVLRACPDGEGDWTHLAEQDVVRTLLVPRAWTPGFVEHACHDLERRHLPLIVDVGGRPRPWQEAIFGCCTHAILLTPDEASRKTWRKRIANHGLQCIADIRSDLHGESQLVERSPVLRGTLAGLEWGTRLRGTLFDALVDRLARLFAYDAQALRRAHERAAPVETVVDLGRMARALGVPHRGQQANWMPHHLPAALDYLPPGVPLGLYDRGPNWLYAALALLAYPAPVYQFDVRLGWVSPAAVRLGQPDDKAPLQVEVRAQKDRTCLEFSLPRAYIDYSAQEVRVPPVPLDRGVLLSGKLPHWLLTGIALAYRPASWLAVYQPPAGGAVVVHSPTGTPPPGSVLPKERHE